jgi:hypothetical protein
MKYLRKFEFYDLIPNGPSIGDYIVAETFGLLTNKTLSSRIIEGIEFIHNNVGTLKNIVQNDNPYIVKYYFPNSILDKFKDDTDNIDTLDECNFKKENILFWSSSKEDSEKFLEGKKYNL